MASETKVCEACGVFDSERQEHHRRMGGDYTCVPLCRECSARNGILIDADISARRSAPQPPKSAEGREIRVGDRVTWKDGDPRFTGTVKSIGSSGHRRVSVEGDGGPGKISGWATDGADIIHLHPEAAPHAPEKTPGTPKCEHKTLRTISSETQECEDCETLITHRDLKPDNVQPTQPPGPSLAAFTAAVEQHLLPRLPNGFSVVTDFSAHQGHVFRGWVLDGDKREIITFHLQDPHFDLTQATSVAGRVGDELMRRSARHQPEPPRDEPSWLDGYLSRTPGGR